MSSKEIHLSFLPLSHIFERMAGHYLMIYLGASIAYAETMDTVPKNLLEVKPTYLLGVPRFYEKIKARVLEALQKAGPVQKALFFWAKDLGKQKRHCLFEKKRRGPAFHIQVALAKGLVYQKFKARLGGRVRLCISGGAPLAKDVAEFFFDLGMPILEGYGLTETSPVISVNREHRFKFGTVGIPMDQVQVKIAPDGEITTQSACVMKGYYKKPEETAQVLTDGWFHTGDLGVIDKDGFLSITGRKKELIVTSTGKKVAPGAIEEMLEKDLYILRCVLFGEGKNFLTALIVPQQEKILEYAKEQKIAFLEYKDLLGNAVIYRFLDHRIQEHCKDLAGYEQIKYFALLEHDFTQSAGELTPTLKIKRAAILARYKDLLLPYYTKEFARP